MDNVWAGALALLLMVMVVLLAYAVTRASGGASGQLRRYVTGGEPARDPKWRVLGGTTEDLKKYRTIQNTIHVKAVGIKDNFYYLGVDQNARQAALEVQNRVYAFKKAVNTFSMADRQLVPVIEPLTETADQFNDAMPGAVITFLRNVRSQSWLATYLMENKHPAMYAKIRAEVESVRNSVGLLPVDMDVSEATARMESLSKKTAQQVRDTAAADLARAQAREKSTTPPDSAGGFGALRDELAEQYKKAVEMSLHAYNAVGYLKIASDANEIAYGNMISTIFVPFSRSENYSYDVWEARVSQGFAGDLVSTMENVSAVCRDFRCCLAHEQAAALRISPPKLVLSDGSQYSMKQTRKLLNKNAETALARYIAALVKIDSTNIQHILRRRLVEDVLKPLNDAVICATTIAMGPDRLHTEQPTPSWKLFEHSMSGADRSAYCTQWNIDGSRNMMTTVDGKAFGSRMSAVKDSTIIPDDMQESILYQIPVGHSASLAGSKGDRVVMKAVNHFIPYPESLMPDGAANSKYASVAVISDPGLMFSKLPTVVVTPGVVPPPPGQQQVSPSIPGGPPPPPPPPSASAASTPSTTPSFIGQEGKKYFYGVKGLKPEVNGNAAALIVPAAPTGAPGAPPTGAPPAPPPPPPPPPPPAPPPQPAPPPPPAPLPPPVQPAPPPHPGAPQPGVPLPPQPAGLSKKQIAMGKINRIKTAPHVPLVDLTDAGAVAQAPAMLRAGPGVLFVSAPNANPKDLDALVPAGGAIGPVLLVVPAGAGDVRGAVAAAAIEAGMHVGIVDDITKLTQVPVGSFTSATVYRLSPSPSNTQSWTSTAVDYIDLSSDSRGLLG